MLQTLVILVFNVLFSFIKTKFKETLKNSKRRIFSHLWKQEENGQGDQDFYITFAGQYVSNDKLKSFFVDFCKNFMNISWFFAVIFRDFG